MCRGCPGGAHHRGGALRQVWCRCRRMCGMPTAASGDHAVIAVHALRCPQGDRRHPWRGLVAPAGPARLPRSAWGRYQRVQGLFFSSWPVNSLGLQTKEAKAQPPSKEHIVQGVEALDRDALSPEEARHLARLSFLTQAVFGRVDRRPPSQSVPLRTRPHGRTRHSRTFTNQKLIFPGLLPQTQFIPCSGSFLS